MKKNVGGVEEVWYDVYRQLDDDAVMVYAGERGQAMTKIADTTTDVPGMPEVVEYFTDGLGKRRYKLVPDDTLTCYRWDAGYNVLTEYVDDTGQWNMPDFTRFFVPMGHTAFAEGVPDANGNPIYGTYNYLAHDHLGTGRFAYDQAKDQIGMVEHDPYGERTNQTGYVPYHEYTGKPFDEETGMYYFPYRYYHPHISRWTTPDPIGIGDGPNVYGYVGGNPINDYDSLGLYQSVCRYIGNSWIKWAICKSRIGYWTEGRGDCTMCCTYTNVHHCRTDCDLEFEETVRYDCNNGKDIACVFKAENERKACYLKCELADFKKISKVAGCGEANTEYTIFGYGDTLLILILAFFLSISRRRRKYKKGTNND